MNEMTHRENLACRVYELTKAVWGFKPDFSKLLTWTEEQLEQEIAILLVDKTGQ